MGWDGLGRMLLLRDQAPAAARNAGVVKVRANPMPYTRRHRGQWFSPEYDFEELSRAQDTDSYLFRSIKKKVDRIITAGYEFSGKNQEVVQYIQRRLNHMALASDRPFAIQIEETAHDLIRYGNCMWSKVRNNELSLGEPRKYWESPAAKPRMLEPVAGYFVLPFETLDLKHKVNGALKKVRQVVPGIPPKEFHPNDVIHFYAHRKPGFSVGTPENFAAIDDIALLRRLEENVEELIETSLFPVFHYRIGTDDRPEVVAPNGKAESEIIREKIEYMPAGSVYVSDHRHEIIPLGSEGHALRIDFYLNYFKNRVFAAIGTTAVDMGEGEGATRATAAQMSKSMMLDIEAVQRRMKIFIDHFVINELLLEGGYDPLDPEHKVEIIFGVIDKADRRADENQAIQAWHAQGLTETEFRSRLGHQGFSDEERKQTFHELYEKPQMELQAQQAAARSEGSARASASQSRPSNQHGTRTAAKTIDDQLVIFEPEGVQFAVDASVSTEKLNTWKQKVHDTYEILKDTGVEFRTVANNMLWRLNG